MTKRYKVTQEIVKHLYENPKLYYRFVEAENPADAMVKFNKELIATYGKQWFVNFATKNVFDYTKVEVVEQGRMLK